MFKDYHPRHAAAGKNHGAGLPHRLTLLIGLAVLLLLGLAAWFFFLLRQDKSVPPAPAAAPAPTEAPVPTPEPEPAPEPAPEPTPQPKKLFPLPRVSLDKASLGYIGSYRPVKLRIEDQYGNVVAEDAAAQWRSHGNSTLRHPKSPYKIKLSRAQDLLGLGEARRFILLANAYDKTMLRNRLVLELAAGAGLDFSSRSAFVDLYRNGVYAGLYQLAEPVEIGRSRVPLHPAANDFLLEVWMTPRPSEGVLFTTPRLGITLELSGMDAPDEAQRRYLEDFFDAAEAALLEGDEEKIARYFDIDSFVNAYIVNEYTKNADTGFASTRFYIRGGKLYAGPVWDFDISLGNDSDTPDFRHKYNGTQPSHTDGWYACVLWWEKLTDCSWFREAFSRRYLELQPLIVNLYEENELGPARIDSLIAEMDGSIEENNRLWPVQTRYDHIERRPPDSYGESVEYLRQWMEERNQWILGEIEKGITEIRIPEPG